jgi:hypothetical protein
LQSQIQILQKKNDSLYIENEILKGIYERR